MIIINRIILLGRLTKDIELRYTQDNKAVANFTIAVNRNFTNNDGVREADFFNCIVWNKQAENISKYCSKGSQVAVEGRLQNRSYESNDGVKRQVAEIVCENVTFLDNKKSGDSIGNNNAKTEEKEEIYDPFKDFGKEVQLSDEDFPFNEEDK